MRKTLTVKMTTFDNSRTATVRAKTRGNPSTFWVSTRQMRSALLKLGTEYPWIHEPQGFGILWGGPPKELLVYKGQASNPKPTKP